MKYFVIAAALLVSSTASATITTQKTDYGLLLIRNTASTDKHNLIEAKAASGSPTVTIPLGNRYAKLRVSHFVTFSASTYVTTKVECSMDDSTFAVLQSRAISAGTATLSDLSDKKTLGGADQSYMTEYDVRGCESVKITIGSDDADVLNVQATAVK